MQLDHLAVAGVTLHAAAAHVAAALQVPLQPGGQHAAFGTHNQLLGLQDGLYLEAIAVDPDAVAPAQPRWFDLDRFTGPPRLANWICRVDDLDAVLKAEPRFGRAVHVSRGDLCWRMAVPENGILPFGGAMPALIEWQSTLRPPDLLATQDLRLHRLYVGLPDHLKLAELLAPWMRDEAGILRLEHAPNPMLAAQFEARDGMKVLR